MKNQTDKIKFLFDNEALVVKQPSTLTTRIVLQENK
jgi:hypothetical protein